MSGAGGQWEGRGMTNTRKILIVDDDSELREALLEQLALHEEFESYPAPGLEYESRQRMTRSCPDGNVGYS